MLPSSLWLHKSFANVDLEDLVFLVVSILSGSCTASSTARFPQPWGEGFEGDIPFGSLTLWIMSGCGSLFIPIYYTGGSFSNDGNWFMSRMSLGVIFLLCSFSRTVFGFTADPWAISSQILGHPSRVKYGFHLMEKASSKSDLVRLLPQALCYHCTSISHRQRTIEDPRVWGWVGVHVGSRIPSAHRVKALCRQQLDFPVFSELCCLQQWGCAAKLWRTTCSLSNSSGCLGVPMRLTMQWDII